MKQLAVFRADAYAAIGGGHIARCLTLANALAKRGWACAFALSRKSLGYQEELAAAGMESVILSEDTPAALRAVWPNGCRMAVVDSYGLDAAFESALTSWADRVMAVDDLANRPHHCDILLDQTFGRDAEAYARLVPEGCRILTGSQYALLRPEFRLRRADALSVRDGSVNGILISMGAMDPDAVTLVALDAVARLGGRRRVDVVLGRSSPIVARVADRCASLDATLHLGLDGGAMADIMARNDLAIGAAGTTAWERCCLGLPTLTVVLADNQRLIASKLAKAGAIAPCTIATMDDALADLVQRPEHLRAMARSAAEICDGAGLDRVIDVVTNPTGFRESCA